MRRSVLVAMVVALVAVPGWALARLAPAGSSSAVAPIEVDAGTGGRRALPAAARFRPARSRAHAATDCDHDGEVEFDDDDDCARAFPHADADDGDDGDADE